MNGDSSDRPATFAMFYTRPNITLILLGNEY